MALLFNDQSVLENYHSSILFQIFKSNPELNIFRNLEKSQIVYIRKLMSRTILCTDMSQHFPVIEKLKSLVSNTISQITDKQFSKDNEEHKIDLISALVHLCDISASSCLELEHSNKWGLRCV